MTIRDTTILLPCHSLEDFPTDRPDDQSLSLLNAVAVAWHPQLLLTSERAPGTHRADEPPAGRPDQLFIVPAASEDWLPHQWAESATAQGARVLRCGADRAAAVTELLGLLEGELPAAADAPHTGFSPDLVADFQSLGFTWLMVELLMRQMRHFSDLDTTRLHRHAQRGAIAATQSDQTLVRAELQQAFDLLLEARERFYPVDCYQLDVCLLPTDATPADLLPLITRHRPISFWATGHELLQLFERHPELVVPFRESIAIGRVGLVCSGWQETPLTLGTLSSFLFQLDQARLKVAGLVGRAPAVWGQQRFGISPQLPRLLNTRGLRGVLHLVLDDGLYPDQESTRYRWQGTGGAVIDACSRIPLAADSPASLQKLPQRLGESMDNDQVAGLIWARWPTLTNPLIADLERSQSFAPVLGTPVTIDKLFESTDRLGKVETPALAEYVTPFLRQMVARRQPDPISRFVRNAGRRRRLDAVQLWSGWLEWLVQNQVIARHYADLELRIEALFALDDGTNDPLLDTELTTAEQDVADRLAHLLGGRLATADEAATGVLLFNSVCHSQQVVVPLTAGHGCPAVAGSVLGVEVAQGGAASRAVLEVPGHGLNSLELRDPALQPTRRRPLAEDTLIRNDWMEVQVSQRTGGIQEVRLHGQRSNRLSQQLGFRYLKEISLPGQGDEPASKTHYAQPRLDSLEIVADTAARGEIRTTGRLLAPAGGQTLAKFVQHVRLWRGRPLLEIDVELSEVIMPDGDPWSTYFASRWAWNDPAAALTMSHLDGAQVIRTDRWETLDFVEIASDQERTTILNGGLPFHQRSGMRMFDTLLIVAGETTRRFQFQVLLDQAYPTSFARCLQAPPIATRVRDVPTMTSWFCQVDQPNVQVEAVSPLIPPPADPDHLPERTPFQAGVKGATIRLRETDGQRAYARLRPLRQPKAARLRDHEGRTINELLIDRDAVLVELMPYDLVEVEVLLAEAN